MDMKSLITPFPALRPTQKNAVHVIAPPYDVLSSMEAREHAHEKPWSFLHISKAEIDLPTDTEPYADEVYAKAAENFARMRQQNILIQDPTPCYYFYRLTMGHHQQTGLVALASSAAYHAQRIRRHEQTQPAKVADRLRQIQALQAQTGPVLLAYKAQPQLDSLMETLTRTMPEIDIVAEDRVQHQLWVITDAVMLTKITEAVNTLPALYIADGHHRSEAGAQTAPYFLAVLFPAQQLQILGYHRLIKDLQGLSSAAFLEKLSAYFILQKSAQPVEPRYATEFGMYLDKQWYCLNFLSENLPTQAREKLDVSLLANYVLDPLLNIKDPRRDPRIEFSGGIRGLKALQERVDSGEMAVAFALYPTPMQQVMQIADQGEFMPPKSTWFEPKLADGLVSYCFAR